ncbi:FRE family ferric-chelate reductase [Blastomyces gilchristii SLH14081]|uniref:FRE family ferric-chelate reductase n=1 Tax=Blastomyces gilchristii (strain SLH14081) TaxID=559298 RepID=A0A179V4A9_BLAGS|nr:FRE family ferric-chelate reductase [Blastomyces gilchristii SLH14081]OAT14257.1 FRE family ferric-chelate reductase [Blastomyces gilchristii SLH14081]
MHPQRFLTPLLIFLASGFSLASEIESTRCILSIAEAVSRLSFTGSLSTPRQIDTCTNRLRTYSIYAAATLYCSSTEIRDGLKVLDYDCEKDGLYRIPYETVRPELTERYLRGLRVVEYGEVSSVELDEVVVVSYDWYERVVRTNRAWAFEMWAHHAFGVFSYWFWGIVLLSGILNRLFIHFSGLQRRGIKYDAEGHPLNIGSRNSLLFSPLRRLRHWVRAYFIIPAAFGTHHQRLFYWCSIPTRIEAIVIVLFYIFSLVLTCVGHDVFRGNLFWDDIFSQIFRYVSDRTGIMSYANLCLLWLFGSRNNPFLWATGWSFATFNLFHRAIARVATIQAIVHSIGYTVLTLQANGSYFLYWPNPWWYMGVVGTVCMSLLLVFSSIWLRRNYYEIFLIIHITFSLIIIIGLFIHTSIFAGEFNLYDRYLWPVVVIWSLDRFARLARLLSCNIHLRLNKKSITYSTSVVSYSEASDIIKLEIIPGSRHLQPKPGHHYYIYQPLRWTGYESHPFTVGSWSAIGNECEHLPSSEASDFSSASTAVQSETSTPRAPKRATTSDLTDAKYKLVFWIRPFDGWTKRLRSDCLKSPKQTLTTSFLIEGPYYGPIELHTFENVILIAGGTGIAAALPHIEEHLRRTETKSHHNNKFIAPSSPCSSSTALHAPEISTDPPRTRTNNISFVWTTRQEAFIHELAARELGPALGRGDITTQFYCTSLQPRSKSQSIGGPTCSRDLQLEQDTMDDRTALLSSVDGIYNQAVTYGNHGHTFPIDIHPRRPDIRNIITRSVQEIGNRGDCPRSVAGRTAILVCGPAEMADEARVAVHEVLKKGYRGVEYFEESFGW